MLKNWKMEHLWLYRMLLFVVVCVLMVGFVLACTHWLYRDITLVTSQGEEVEAVTMAATVGEYLDSVSYTHLDVYKRQAFSRFRID